MPRVLVIDDQESIVNGLKRAFSAEGFAVETSRTASEALTRIHEKSFDFIITDLKMPGMSGLELIRKLREEKNPAKSVIISAYLNLEDVMEALRLGVHDIFQKPFDNTALLSRIKELAPLPAAGIKKGERSFYLIRETGDDFHLVHYYRDPEKNWKVFHQTTGKRHFFCYVFQADKEAQGFIRGAFQALCQKAAPFKEMVSFMRDAMGTNTDCSFILMEMDSVREEVQWSVFGPVSFLVIPGTEEKQGISPRIWSHGEGNFSFSRNDILLFNGGEKGFQQRDALSEISKETLKRKKLGWPHFSKQWLSVLAHHYQLLSLEDPILIVYFLPDKTTSYVYETEWASLDVRECFQFFRETLEMEQIPRKLIVRFLSALAELFVLIKDKRFEKAFSIDVRFVSDKAFRLCVSGANIGSIVKEEDEEADKNDEFLSVPRGARFIRKLVDLKNENNLLILESVS
ncbi:MAG: response regulator [Candidatus Aureabacteria bacterium]|nr:response regulator [Candidatus Auribacterota bacterium]